MLNRIGREWLEKAPTEHTAWGYIWPRLWEETPGDAALDRSARQFLRNAPVSHGSWGHVWQTFWVSKRGDPGLEESARAWLSGAPPTHRSWSHVWTHLWEQWPADAQLEALAREWLLNAPSHAGWVYVGSELLERFPGDIALLTAAQAALDLVPNSAWPSLWMRMWDFGGDRAQLAPLGFTWLFKHGQNSGGFSFIWERLWAMDPKDQKLHDIGISWLRANSADKKWRFVAYPLSEINPQDSELLQIARSVAEGSHGARPNRAAASRILSDASDRHRATRHTEPVAMDEYKAYRDEALAVRRHVNRFVDQQQWDDAEQHLIHLIEASEMSGHDLLLGIALIELGGVFRKRERMQPARAALLQALDIFTHKKPHSAARAAALHKLGDLCYQEKLWIDGEEAYRGAMLLRWSLGEMTGYAISLDSLAMLHKDYGLIEAARAEATEALEIFTLQGTERQRAQCRALLKAIEEADLQQQHSQKPELIS